MADGFMMDAQNLLANGNKLAIAAGEWQDSGTELGQAKMADDLLGVLGQKFGLPAVYNSALTVVTGKINDAVTSMENSIKAIEKAVNSYNQTDQASMDKIVYAGSDLTDSPIKPTK